MTLAKRLRAAIEGKNISQAWVAEEVGMTPSALNLILTGKSQDPSFFTVLAIARAIGEPLSAIVDDPLHYWTDEELSRLAGFGSWLVERTTREQAGRPLEIPPRKRKSAGTKVHPVAATSGVIYPDASELSKRRIPKRYAKADAVFTVHGESMTGANIYPGDLLYRGRNLLLESAHPDHDPMIIDEASARFSLIGIVIGTSRT